MTVIIGMDPHKRSATIEVIDEHETVVAVGRYGTDKDGYAAMLAAGRVRPDRVWAVEGCNGIGRHIAHRLVHDGETVVDQSDSPQVERPPTHGPPGRRRGRRRKRRRRR